jgi:hypothetical protein
LAKRGRPKSSFKGNEDILGDFFNQTDLDQKSLVDQFTNKLKPVPKRLPGNSIYTPSVEVAHNSKILTKNQEFNEGIKNIWINLNMEMF